VCDHRQPAGRSARQCRRSHCDLEPDSDLEPDCDAQPDPDTQPESLSGCDTVIDVWASFVPSSCVRQ